MSSWYFSKDGQQEGPVTAGQLVALAEASTLDPATTLVWREGLADWIPLNQSPLSEEVRSLPTPVVAPVKQVATVMNPYSVSPTTLAASRANRPDMPLEYPGIGRLAYFLSTVGFSIVFYVILFVIIYAAMSAESGAAMGIGMLLVTSLLVGVSIYIGVKRVTNLGMSGWAILWSIVPFMNIWIAWRMIACPAGYEAHRTLDTAGKVISGFCIGFLVLTFLLPLIGVLVEG